MANEFVHLSAGEQLTSVEDDAIGRHVFNSQATGDIMIATSATQLSRLAKGTQGYPLIMGASVPQWGGSMVLNGPLDANSQVISNIASGAIIAAGSLRSEVVNSYIEILGGTSNALGGSFLIAGHTWGGGAGVAQIATPNAAANDRVVRLAVSGKLAIAVALWANITHTGIKLSGALDVAGQYLTFLERAAPGAGATNEARIYAIVGGDTFTDLSAVFQDGSIDNFATETTPDNSPLFITPSGMPLQVRLKKDHPGLIRIVAVFPNGEEFDLKNHEYHHPNKIAANIGCDNALPQDWLVEDDQQIAFRLAKEEAERQAQEKLLLIIDEREQEVGNEQED